MKLKIPEYDVLLCTKINIVFIKLLSYLCA